jgi:hypothetical protein
MSFMRRSMPGIGAAAGRCSEVPNGFPARVRHGPLSYPVGCRVVTIVRGRDFVHEFDGS